MEKLMSSGVPLRKAIAMGKVESAYSGDDETYGAGMRPGPNKPGGGKPKPMPKPKPGRGY